MLTYEQLKQLRGEIVLNSIFVKDYSNSLGIDPQRVCDFFEGYLEYKMICFSEDNPKATPKQKDRYFDKVLQENDIQDMYDYYQSIEGDYLPIEDEKEQ